MLQNHLQRIHKHELDYADVENLIYTIECFTQSVEEQQQISIQDLLGHNELKRIENMLRKKSLNAIIDNKKSIKLKLDIRAMVLLHRFFNHSFYAKPLAESSGIVALNASLDQAVSSYLGFVVY